VDQAQGRVGTRGDVRHGRISVNEFVLFAEQKLEEAIAKGA
jgi:hypothetical protein